MPLWERAGYNCDAAGPQADEPSFDLPDSLRVDRPDAGYGGTMFTLFVTVKIKPGHRDEFIAATKGDAEGSNTAEPRCLRFDVLADNNDPNTVYLYEVYEDRDAWETAHRGMPHYTQWRETVADWFDGDPQRIETTTLFRREDFV